MKSAILTCALVLAGLACAGRPRVEAPASADGQESLEVEGQTVRPRLLNREELNRALLREYPARLKDRGIGGTTSLQIFIDVEGIVRNQLVSKSSGNRELDNAALKVVRVARFSPANNGEERVAVWIEIDIAFRADLDPRASQG